jgi:hypothetical protein
MKRRLQIKDYGLKIKEARIARKIKYSRLAKKITDSKLGRKIYDLRFRIYETRLVRKIKHLRISRKVKKHKKLSVSLTVLLIVIPIVVGILAYIQNNNNKKFATDLPYQEKIADGAWILHNYENTKVKIESKINKKPDLNLKEVINVGEAVAASNEQLASSDNDGNIARPFDSLKYRWMVQISTGTYFEFGGVDRNTPEGKVLPVVRVRNSSGSYIAFSPSQLKVESEKLNGTDYGSQISEDKESSNLPAGKVGQKSSISNLPAGEADQKSITRLQASERSDGGQVFNQYVAPKVEGNVISWEITDGITARYTMMQDRVKADYIVDKANSLQQLANGDKGLAFDFEYEGGEIIKKPDGSISLSYELENIFEIPAPLVIDKNKKEFEGTYDLIDNKDGIVSLSIILPPEKIAEAQFPLIVDPVIIDSTLSDGLRYDYQKNIVRDKWGNLIVVSDGGDSAYDDVFYKNYDADSWIDADLDLDYRTGSDNSVRFGIDIDSAGDVHVGYYDDDDGNVSEGIFYSRLNVIRNSNNEITNIIISENTMLDPTLNAQRYGPSVIVANKGAGEGKEKVVFAWPERGSTPRSEMRVLQKDIWNVGYEDMILADNNLVGYWRLNERDYGSTGTTGRLDDISGNDNDATTVSGSPSFGQEGGILGDPENSSINFTRGVDRATVPHSTDFNVGDGPLSVEFWGKLDTAASQNEWAFGKWASDQGYSFGKYSGGSVAIYNENTPANYTLWYSTETPIDDTDWHHFAFTKNGSTVKLYADGVPLTVTVFQPLGSPVFQNNTNSVGIGADGTNFINDWGGDLDEIAFYNDVLTDAEIKQRYEKGRETYYSNIIKATPGLSGYWRLGTPSGTIAYDESGNGNHGTYQDSPTLGEDGATGIDNDTAVTFDGTQDNQVLISDDDAFDFGSGVDYSLEAWIKNTETSGDNYIIGHSGDGSSDDWSLHLSAGAEKLNARIGTSTYTSDETPALTDGRWHHVVFSADRDGSGTFYMDGLEIGSADISSQSTTVMNTTDDLFIASRLTNGSEFHGSIDEVAIYKGVALTAEQVMEHYQAANSWKNVSEEKNANGTCSESYTRGEVGFPSSLTCRGAADPVVDRAYDDLILGLVNQIPGKPPRSPDSVKWDDNGSFSNLTNAFDGDRTTTSSINGFTTADYLYVGDAKPFSKVTVDMYATNSATADFALTDVEYCSLSYDGTTCTTWSDLPNFYDNTDNGTSAFSEDGSLLFDEPDNWATVTVNSTAGKYWVRFRPDAAMDSDVKIAEITVNHRNSNALMMIAGSDGGTNGLQPGIVVWDDITNDGWENRPDSAGSPWWHGDVTTGFWGFANDIYTARWTYSTGATLQSGIDYINSRFYVSFLYDEYVTGPAPTNLYAYSMGNNKDPLDRDNWIDTGVPARGPDNEGIKNNSISWVNDGKDMFLVINPDSSGTQSAYLIRCTPYAGSDPNICDNRADWGSQIKFTEAGDVDHLDAVATKPTSDLSAIDIVYQGDPHPLYHERLFVEGNDRNIETVAGEDDAYHMNCALSSNDDQENSGNFIVLGWYQGSSACPEGSTELDSGIRFQNIDVAPGAKISSAYIEIQSGPRYGTVEDIPFTIYGEDVDNSSSFSNYTNNCPAAGGATSCIGDRTKTINSKSFSVEFPEDGTATEGLRYRFDVTDMVQEIVCRGVIGVQPCVGDFNSSGGWASGNALSILMISDIDSSTYTNLVNIYEHDNPIVSNYKPKLVINCEDSCDEPKPQEAEWCSLGGFNGNGSNDCNNNWGSRKKITFDNRASSENLTDFPTLIRLDSTKIDYSKVQNAGQDLRFVDATGGAKLNHEVQTWDETGESLVWVRVPQIDAGSNTDYIYMYYNNASASAGMNRAETWNSVYKGVWHLDEDPTGTLYDAVGVNNGTGEDLESDDQVPSYLDGGIDFDGSFEEINAGSNSSIDNLTSFSRSAWIKINDYTAGDYFTISSFGADRWRDWFFLSSGSWDAMGLRYYLEHPSGTAAYAYCYNAAQGAVEADQIYDGEWHHVAVSYDQGGTNRWPYMYIDGKECTYGTGRQASVGTRYDTSANNLYIGGSGGATNDESMVGVIDEHRLAGTARSGDWIEAEYLNTRKGSTFVSYGSEETDPTTSDYEALIKGNSELVGYWRLGEPANYTEFVQSLNPIGYWPMDDASGNFRDASGNGFTATSNGPPDYQQTGPTINGQAQSGVRFQKADSPTEYGTFSNTIDDNVTTSTGMTISTWFKVPPSANAEPLVSQADTSNQSWLVTLTSDGGIAFRTYQTDGSTTSGDAYYNGTFDDDQWHHIVAWVDGSTGYIYTSIDGGTYTASDTTIAGTWNAETNSWGAMSSFSSSGASPSNSTLSHVAYWDYELTAAERAALYNNGKIAFDESSTANHGSYENNPQLGVRGAILGDKDTAATFNGTTQYVNIADNNAYSVTNTNQLSVEAWVDMTSADEKVIVGKGTASNYEWAVYQYQFNSLLCLQIYQLNGSSLALACATNLSQDWHHFVATIDSISEEVSVYVDGQLEATDDTWVGSPSNGTSVLNIGRRPDNQHYFNSTVDDVAIYSDVLSAEEILQHYNTGRASLYQKTITNTEGLVGYWRLGEGSGTVAEDLSSTGNDGTYTNSPTLGQAGAIKGDNDSSVLIGSGTNYVSIPDNNALDVGDTFSIAFWAKQQGAYNRYYLYKGTNAYGVYRDTDGTIGFGKPGSGEIANSSSTMESFGEWHHIVVTKNGSTTNVYFDGVDETVAGTNYTIENNSTDLWIGSDDGINGIGAYMDEVAIYNRALTADEVREHYLAGGGTNRYNLRQFSKGVTTATGSASFSDLDAKFSSADYIAVQGNDETYVDISADVNVSRNPDLNPMFMLKVNNAKNKNTDRINATAVVKSSVPTSINPIYMQVYNADVGNWVTIATDASSKADTDITLTGVTINANLQSYYINETSGVGTVGDLCTDGSSNCWTYFRIYQDTVDDSYNTILSLDAFDESFDSVPSTLAFTNAWNYIPTNTCSGSSGSFTVQMQDENGSVATPTQLTTVRITSNTGGTLTVYSDSACINPVTNGDLIFTTSDTSKTFYIKDTGISNDYTLTATAQSGDQMSPATSQYTIEGGLRLDSRTRIRGGGDTETRIRGGTRFR